VDYNIFLATRAREEALTGDTRQGMLTALAVTGGVITSAGILLAAVFAVLGVLPLVFIASVNVPMLAGCAFIVGLGVAPTLITCFGVIDTTVPAAALTEGFAWLVTGLSLGYGAGSALVGGIADAHGARVAFTVTIASGLTMGLLAQVLYHRLHESRQASQPVAVG
jgi:MFS family permease